MDYANVVLVATNLSSIIPTELVGVRVCATATIENLNYVDGHFHPVHCHTPQLGIICQTVTNILWPYLALIGKVS